MVKSCNCGSGQPRYELVDARGIFVSFVCGACESKVKQKYRPEIFEDSNYEASEPIEEEDPRTFQEIAEEINSEISTLVNELI